MKMNYLSLLVETMLGLAGICTVSAQQILPSVEWERFYQNAACTFGSVAQTADGGYILGGTIYDIAGVARGHNVLVKVGTDGDIQWEKPYGGSVRQTGDGGYVFATTSDSAPSGNQELHSFGQEDAWVVKLDAEGKILWEQPFGGTEKDSTASSTAPIWQTVDGGYILAAYSASPPSGNKEAELFGGADGWVVKIDAQGKKEWDRSFGGASNDSFSSVRQVADGGYVLAGYSFSPPSGNKGAPNFGSSDGWLGKIDADGNRLWDESFGGAEFDSFLSLDQTADGGFVLAGGSASHSSGNEEFATDYWIVNVNAAGNKQWERSYGTRLFSEQVKVVWQTSDKGYLLCGISRLIKTDSQGNQQWEQLFGKTNANNPTGQPYAVETADLQQTKDGGYIVCGSFNYPNAGIPAFGCVGGSWVAKVENVVSNSGEVVTWKAGAGLVLESVDDLNGEWKSDQAEVLSIGVSSAIALVPLSQQRYYRLRKTGPSSDSPSLSIGALLKWPVAQNQTLETASSKDGPWEAFSGEQGILREAHYAIIPRNLRHHYFRTRK